MAAALPDWMLLDRFVFRRDDDASFLDDEAAPWACGTTSQGGIFRIAFRIVEPPSISCLYLQWPGGPQEGSSCDVVSAHRNLLLLRLTSSPVEKDESLVYPQDYILCEGRPSSMPDQPPLQLHQIPSCTIPSVFLLNDGRTRTAQRSFDIHTVGILCHGEKFAIAQLAITGTHSPATVEAELCVLRSKVISSDHIWEVEKHLQIKYVGAVESIDLVEWKTETVVPFKKFLCWVSYGVGGILLCKVFKKRPTIEYLRLPACYEPGDADLRSCSVCTTTTQDGNELMYINVTNCFIISGHFLRNESGYKQWERVLNIRPDDLSLRDLGRFIEGPLIFPLVNMVKQNMLYFLVSEEEMYGADKVSVLSFDITADWVSIHPYITLQEDLLDEDSDVVMRKSYLLDPFIPSELPRFLRA